MIINRDKNVTDDINVNVKIKSCSNFLNKMTEKLI